MSNLTEELEGPLTRARSKLTNTQEKLASPAALTLTPRRTRSLRSNSVTPRSEAKTQTPRRSTTRQRDLLKTNQTTPNKGKITQRQLFSDKSPEIQEITKILVINTPRLDPNNKHIVNRKKSISLTNLQQVTEVDEKDQESAFNREDSGVSLGISEADGEFEDVKIEKETKRLENEKNTNDLKTNCLKDSNNHIPEILNGSIKENEDSTNFGENVTEDRPSTSNITSDEVNYNTEEVEEKGSKKSEDCVAISLSTSKDLELSPISSSFVINSESSCNEDASNKCPHNSSLVEKDTGNSGSRENPVIVITSHDSEENSNQISVSSSVVNNQSLDCIDKNKFLISSPKLVPKKASLTNEISSPKLVLKKTSLTNESSFKDDTSSKDDAVKSDSSSVNSNFLKVSNDNEKQQSPFCSPKLTKNHNSSIDVSEKSSSFLSKNNEKESIDSFSSSIVDEMSNENTKLESILNDIRRDDENESIMKRHEMKMDVDECDDDVRNNSMKSFNKLQEGFGVMMYDIIGNLIQNSPPVEGKCDKPFTVNINVFNRSPVDDRSLEKKSKEKSFRRSSTSLNQIKTDEDDIKTVKATEEVSSVMLEAKGNNLNQSTVQLNTTDDENKKHDIPMLVEDKRKDLKFKKERKQTAIESKGKNFSQINSSFEEGRKTSFILDESKEKKSNNFAVQFNANFKVEKTTLKNTIIDGKQKKIPQCIGSNFKVEKLKKSPLIGESTVSKGCHFNVECLDINKLGMIGKNKRSGVELKEGEVKKKYKPKYNYDEGFKSQDVAKVKCENNQERKIMAQLWGLRKGVTAIEIRDILFSKGITEISTVNLSESSDLDLLLGQGKGYVIFETEDALMRAVELDGKIKQNTKHRLRIRPHPSYRPRSAQAEEWLLKTLWSYIN